MSRSITKRRAVTLGTAAALAAAGLITLGGSANAAAGTTGVASPALGTNVAGTVVSITGTGFRDSVTNAATVTTPKLVLASGSTAAACTGTAATWTSPVYSVLSATRITVTLPAVTIPATVSTLKGVICFPSVSSSTTFTSVPYTFAKPVTAPSGTKNLPASGPMSGGQTVTVLATPDVSSGTPAVVTTANGSFQAGASVFVGGVPAAAPKIAADGKSLTFVTPLSSATTAQDILVRTPGFADYVVSGGYTYTRAITISPAVGTTTMATPISIKGAGFLSSTYTGAGGVHVYLSDGQQYDSTGTAVDPTACANVQVVSDTEVTCDVPTGSAGPLSVIVTDDTWANMTAANSSVVSRGSIFVRADF